ncbi:PREDICTED: putative mediator of RNA polymerase II transcription subunit 26 isoform X2 [Drosophila arizonae]|uniref:Mediator of RNA polymerase II transcription subunit 26 isoform X2 n=1 Tax=Drosophila arizonae TaxID=7263 RepID=A0ABM1PMT0_DROAR|nr:PREDICTED: putative mediator of RNA polymerase II transcription subunit 26 isoform X2 [Drosophila arizonae]
MQNSAVLSRATSKTTGKSGVAKTTEPKKNEPSRSQSLNRPPIKRLPNLKKSALALAGNKTTTNNNTNSTNNTNNTNNNANDANNTTNNPTTSNANSNLTITTNNNSNNSNDNINNINNINNNNNNNNAENKPLAVSQPTTPGLSVGSATSATSFLSRRTDADSEDAPPKTKTKFTRPRMNQLTEQRINRLRSSAADGAHLAVVRSHSETPASQAKKKGDQTSSQTSICVRMQEDGVEPLPCPQALEMLQRGLEDMQSEFMRKAADFRGKRHGYSYKLVAIVHNDNCKVLVHRDDLLAMPKNLPAHSLNDFRNLCHNTLREGVWFIFEQIASVQSKDNSLQTLRQEELRRQLDGHLSNKLAVVDNELMEMCKAAGNDESAKLRAQICELTEENSELVSANSKLEMDVVDIRKQRDELKTSLDISQKRCDDLALELADKNILLVKKAGVLEDMIAEIKNLKKTNKILQQRQRESDTTIDGFRLSNEKLLSRIEDLESQVLQAQSECLILQKKMDELMEDLAEKETIMAEQRAQLQDQELTKTLQSESTSNEPEPDAEHLCDLQAELERQQMRLAEQEQREQALRLQLEQKQEELNKVELKVSRLEEQNEHHRQVLAVRGERINYLDQEMKQRELESNRKLNEIMAQTSDKNTLITQMTNELAATNEQFQNLCSKLTAKQTKLHSQEHVIKLLEESNERSVKLHTKLGEKNAMLKDELDHLRRTVNNLMLANDVNDAPDVPELVLE